MKQPKVRVTLDLPSNYRDRLIELKQATGSASQADLICKAILTLEAVMHVKIAEGKLIAKYPDGTSDTLITP